MITASVINRAMAAIAPGDWVDLAGLAILAICAIAGKVRGLSGLLSSLLGLLLALLGGNLLHAPLAAVMKRIPYCRDHSWAGDLLPYILAVGAVLAGYLILSAMLRRFFKLVIGQPVDGLLGLVAGLLQGLLVLVFACALAGLLPEGSAMRVIVCEESRSGSVVAPRLRRALNALWPAPAAPAPDGRRR